MEKLLTIREVSKALGVPKSTVYTWVRTGVLPAFRPGKRKVFILPKRVEEMLNGSYRPHTG